ncbi:MAG TPA: M56 family metallopeptidase [Candidatus Sulfotelmatobacter sp.]|nr:M56 family metallopeptidase [Candidatus Sulfotelmatobacter sp.]
MTILTSWLSPNLMRDVAWALLHFLWQGAALAALAAAAMALCRRASARYAIALSVLVLMLAAPVATLVVTGQLQPSAGFATAHDDQTLLSVSFAGDRAAHVVNALAPKVRSAASSWNAFSWMVEVWLAGVAFFSLRSAGGFLLLERQRRKQSIAVNARVLAMCRALQQRIALKWAIRYCEGEWLQAPAVVGWFRPIVFLPIQALTGLSQAQLELVVAHELAHIQRFDPFVNVFQVVVEALLFYHPAVWWLNRRIRAERENCCDDVAISLCGNAVEYARALTLMEEWRSVPVFAMAANRGPLTDRILRLLGLRTLGAGMRGIGITGSAVCLTAALVAGNALFGLAYARPVLPGAAFSPQVAQESPEASQASPASKPSPARPQSNAQPASTATTATSYIDAMKASGIGELTIDELIAMKIQGVTPDYVRELHEQGLHPDADTIIAFRVQGITAAYIHELRGLGFDPDPDEIIAFKVQHVDAGYVRGLKDAGLKPNADQIIALKVQGVTPDYVKQLRSADLNPDADQIIAMKVQGITPAYVHDLHELGLKPDADDLVGMKVQGVSPEYIRAIQATGLKPGGDDLIAMRVQGVTAEFIKSLMSAGFKVDIDDVVSAKVQGLTSEFIEKARKHGFKDLDLEKLIELKRLNVLEPQADI